MLLRLNMLEPTQDLYLNLLKRCLCNRFPLLEPTQDLYLNSSIKSFGDGVAARTDTRFVFKPNNHTH